MDDFAEKVPLPYEVIKFYLGKVIERDMATGKYIHIEEGYEVIPVDIIGKDKNRPKKDEENS